MYAKDSAGDGVYVSQAPALPRVSADQEYTWQENNNRAKCLVAIFDAVRLASLLVRSC